MVLGGADLVTVKEILGHSTIEMTMRYSHPTPESKQRALAGLAEFLEEDNETQERLMTQKRSKTPTFCPPGRVGCICKRL